MGDLVAKTAASATGKTCMVSVDVEEDLLEGTAGSAARKSFCGAENLDLILTCFEQFKIRATLFVTGEVLEAYPQLVQKWCGRHEIACHGYYHQPLHQLSIPERERQLEACIKAHSAVLTGAPKGFRAVMHTIDSEQISLLEKFGFAYDSSVVPDYVPFRKYIGYKGPAPNHPYWPSRSNHRLKGDGKVLEIPNSPLIMGIPLAGTWIRMLGPVVFRGLLAVKKPDFVSLAMHSWDAVVYRGPYSRNSGEEFIDCLEEVLATLTGAYKFACAEDIASSLLVDARSPG